MCSKFTKNKQEWQIVVRYAFHCQLMRIIIIVYKGEAELSFLCIVLHNIATDMHIKFEVVLTRDDKVIFRKSSPCHCCKNDDQRDITQRQREADV